MVLLLGRAQPLLGKGQQALAPREIAPKHRALVTILFFSSVGFDAKKETTSPAVHVLTKANWAVMAVFALTIVIPILLK